MATSPGRREGEAKKKKRDDMSCEVGEEAICRTKVDKKLGNKIPSVIVEDTSAHVVRTPSKVGNKDFEVL